MRTNKDENILILGISNNQERYSFLAYKRLLEHDYTHLIGVTPKKISLPGIVIKKTLSEIDQLIHTIILYVGEKNLTPFINDILNLKPKRIIFNPGTENRSLIDMAKKNEIEVVEVCTLVMLSTGQF